MSYRKGKISLHFLDWILKKSLKEVIYKGNRNFWNVAKPVRHQILTLEITGSNPVIPAKIYRKRESASLKLVGAIAPNSRDKSPKSRGFYRSQVGKAHQARRLIETSPSGSWRTSDSGDRRFESCYPNNLQLRLYFFSLKTRIVHDF